MGSDKNRKNSVRSSAKNNISGTTSMTNNGIQNAKTLSKCDKHNYRKYDNEQEQIVIVRGTSSLYKDVQDFYKTEFEEARLEYNNKQTRDDRKIDDYFKKVSDNSKSDLACEIIIELGDKNFWDTKDLDYKHKMTNVYSKQVDDLELIMPNFKVCSAIIHYDETSPHMHIVGVPIKYNCKTGMSMQVGKTDVFTRTSLKQIQDKMRTMCIEEYNNEYNLDTTLKQKLKGRNRDIHVSDMSNYQQIKQQLDKNKDKLVKVNEKYTELKNDTKDIKVLLDDLKITPLSKNNYVLKKEDKDKLIDFIDKVDKTNNEYDNLQELFIALNDVDSELRENRKKIKTLTKNNKRLNLRVQNLNKKVDLLEDEIVDLKNENISLKGIISSFKEKLKKLLKFLSNKMFDRYERENYYEVSKALYTHGIISNDEMYEIKDDYDYAKENNKKSHQKDNLEL